jgi:CHASE1-domain containing sensor protein
MKDNTTKKQYVRSKRDLISFPTIVFLLLVAIVVTLWFFVGGLIENTRHAEFKAETAKIEESILNRFEIYTNALHGGQGFFSGSKEVDRDEWHNYVETLGIKKNYPGIQGIGYTAWIEPSELESHIKTIHDEGFPEYSVWPEGDRSHYTAIIYLEPFDVRNQQAFGFDMYQEATRRTGMDKARDTGGEALSGKVILVQEIDEDVQAGFLIYTPIYNNNKPHTTLQERRDALEGFVYSPFRMGNFIKGIVDDTQIVFEIFDGMDTKNLTSDTKMYGDHFISDSSFFHINTIIFAEHGWTIRYSAPPSYKIDQFREGAVLVILIGGCVLSALVAFIIYSFNTRRAKAVLLAESMTEDLKKKTEENERIRKDVELVNHNLKDQTEVLAEKIRQVELANRLMVGRELKMIELKKQLEEKDSHNS